MRKLLNTLFVTTPDTYLALDGENVVVYREEEILLRVPLHTLESILYFGYKGASPALMGACAERSVRLAFVTPNGRFLAAAAGRVRGNVLLRTQQVRASDDPAARVRFARNFVFGKVYNARWTLERAVRDHAMRLDIEEMKKVSKRLAAALPEILACMGDGQLRGLEGAAAEQYFSVFDQMILQNKDSFYFHGRSRRPPLDNVNALLSFCVYPAGKRLRRRAGSRGAGSLYRLSSPGKAGQNLSGARPDGRTALCHGRPVCADINQ